MSKLHSISISGIRSFGIERDDCQNFKFMTPLTIFLGQNGCGKTTIIEAIKYACTAEIPGGTKSGQGFVSDPYMHQVPDVKGQIKLNIQDVHGNKATIVRVLRCAKHTKNSLKFSTLDSSVRFIKQNGEEDNISGRSNDLNEMVISLLGVPAAILNNVIFCHQEQSLWPLDEGSILKKKFDEIFDSVKHNNCVDSLRKLHKIKTEEIKRLQIALEGDKKFKEEVDSKRNTLEEKNEKFENVCQEIKNKEEKLVPIDKRLEEICKLEQNLAGLQSQLAIKNNEKRNIANAQSDLLKNLKNEFQGIDSELEEEITSFNERDLQRKSEITKLEKQKEEVEKSEYQIVKIIQKKNNTLVETKKDIENMNNKIKERDDLIVGLSADLKCSVEIDTLENVDKTSSLIRSAIDKLKNDIKKEATENKNNNEKLQNIVDDFTKKFNEAEQEKKFITNQINDLQTEMRDIRSKLKDLTISDDTLQNYEKKINLIEKDLKILSETFNEKEMVAKIANDKRSISTLTDELEDLENEREKWQKNSVIDKEIENLRSLVLNKQNVIDKIQDEHTSNFEELFDEIPKSNVRKSVEQKLQQNRLNVNELNNKMNVFQKKVTTLELELKHKNTDLKNSEDELKKCRKNITDLCVNLSYQEKLNSLEAKLNKLQKEKGQLSSGKIMYETFIENINTDKCCPICSTNFDNKQQAIKEIVQTIQNKIQNIPKKLSMVEEKLKVCEATYKKLTQLAPSNEKIEELNTKIPQINSAIDNQNRDLNESRKKLNSLKNDISKHNRIIEISGKVLSSATIMDENTKEISKANNNIESLSMELIKVDTNKSKLQIESEIDNKKHDLAKLRQNCEDIQNKLNKNSKKYQDLREERGNFVQKQFDLQKLVQGKPQLMDRLVVIEEKERELKDNFHLATSKIETHKIEIQKAKMHRDTVVVENEDKLKSLEGQYHSYEGKYRELQKAISIVQDLVKSNLMDKLKLLADDIAALKTKQQEIVDRKEEILENIGEKKVQLANQEHHLRMLKDNVSLREKRKLAKLIETDIEQLNQQIGNHNYSSVLKEKNTLHTKRRNTNDSLQISIGMKKELADSITDLKKELLRPHYSNAFVTYKNKFIQCSVLEEANKNLKLYTTTLETAICEFHKTRMKEINKSIRQLWRHIYRGTDIDYIEIETEITYSATKRLYQYKVMQLKNGIKMEMRGRCSAGQKVLASLIIRIALAETFSANCGILALDEPTTNLDRENIDSLCESLVNIINSRSAQTNFQLLIITHDEEFLYKLRNVQQLKHYFRVMRDRKGSTVIKSEAL